MSTSVAPGLRSVQSVIANVSRHNLLEAGRRIAELINEDKMLILKGLFLFGY